MALSKLNPEKLILDIIPESDSSLYTSLQIANGSLGQVSDQTVRKQVAEFIRTQPTLYCRIDGDAELIALAHITQLNIYVIRCVSSGEVNSSVRVIKYSMMANVPDQCIFLQWSQTNNHYQPLYRYKRHQSDKKQYRFHKNDEQIFKLFEEYIHTHCEDRSFRLASIETWSIPANRNITGDDPSVEANANNPRRNQMSPSMTSLLDIERLPKRPRLDSDRDPNTHDSQAIISGSNLLTIEDPFEPSAPLSNHCQAVKTPAAPTSKQMCLRVEPMERFRGRTAHEYKPAKSIKRNGEPSAARYASYFADRANEHHLDLLIPKQHLTDKSKKYQIGVHAITREIEGYSYVHPYFKFQKHPSDYDIPDENPLFIDIDLEGNAREMDGMIVYRLYLTLIMLTNAELEANARTLTVFSDEQDGKTVTMPRRRHDELKMDYHLNEVRFAFSLWEKDTNPDSSWTKLKGLNCISQISTQDKTFKVRSS